MGNSGDTPDGIEGRLEGAAPARPVDPAAIAALAKALTSTFDREALLRRIGEQISRHLGADRWSVRLAGHEPTEGGEPAPTSPIGERAGSIERHKVAVPLEHEGRAIGALEVEVEGDLSRDRRSILQAIADFAAIGIENARSFQRVEELTITDDLTGLFNARHLHSLLGQEFARAARFERPLTLVFLDLDNFKAVNDAHGHPAGSRLLSEVGAILRGSIRRIDSAFRYGGDEFALILVETGVSAGIQVSERIRDKLRRSVLLESGGQAIKLTASFGIATYPDHASSDADLLQAADRAMYRAKALGRDEIVSTV